MNLTQHSSTNVNSFDTVSAAASPSINEGAIANIAAGDATRIGIAEALHAVLPKMREKWRRKRFPG